MLNDIAARRQGFLVVGWGMLVVASLVAAALMHRLGLSVTTREIWLVGAAMVFLLALAQLYARRDPRICALADICAYLLCMTVVLIVTSYVAAACGGAPWDGNFAAVDRFLGFDWLTHFRYVDSRPALTLVLGYIYNSFLVQPLLIIFVLSFTGQVPRLRMFALLYVTCAIAVVVLSGLFPALGAYDHYLPATRAAAMAGDHVAAHSDLQQLIPLREGRLRLIDLAESMGIVTFPSFHTVASVLFAWALVRTRYLAVPALVLNALVIVSTLSIGGHYLTDVIAGGLLAGLAIAVAAGRFPSPATARTQPLAPASG